MSRMFRSNRLSAALGLVLWTAGLAQAQPAQAQPAQEQPDPNLKPTFGSAKLNAGFLPDPYTIDLQAGGNIRTNLGGVKAHVAKAPDFSLHYTKGKYALSFTVKSAGDTTLLINLPDGSWVADDDSGGGLDPMIRIAEPASGRYDIYVGTYQKELVAATLNITERDLAKKPAPPFNPNLPECHILSAGVDGYAHPGLSKLKGCLNDARNTVAAFQAQTGTMFRSVKEHTLLDGAASRDAIYAGFQGFTKQGAAGDYMVLFLSGHGARTNGNKGPTWFFLPYDYHPKQFTTKALTDKQILDVGDELVRQKKNVVIIIDACYCGQLGVTAQSYFQRHKNPNEGMILMLSSSPDQTSAALGNYSAYAKAFADTMAGAGDLNKDTKITLGEIQAYSKKRTADLLATARNPDKQDSIVTWSPSISKETTLAYAGKSPALAAAKPLPNETPLRWTGSETLPGYGNLSFALYSNGRAIMVDAKSTSEGIWRKQDKQYTLSFANGAVVYTGTVEGATLSGTATSPSARQEAMKSWTWTVKQPG